MGDSGYFRHGMPTISSRRRFLATLPKLREAAAAGWAAKAQLEKVGRMAMSSDVFRVYLALRSRAAATSWQ